MKFVQTTLLLMAAYLLGIYSTEEMATAHAPTPTKLAAHSKAQGCHTDMLVVFPFRISQDQLVAVTTALYEEYPEWLLEKGGVTMLQVEIHVPDPAQIDEIKLESKQIGSRPVLCLQPEQRKEIEAVAAQVLK